MGIVPLRAATGLIGSVYSAFYGALPAEIELTDEADASKRFTGKAGVDGIFRFPDLPPGQYSMRVRYMGMRDPSLHSVRIQPGTLTDVGGVRVIASCEDPQQGCVGLARWVDVVSGDGKIEMSDGCAMDLNEQKPWCPGTSAAPGPFSLDDDFHRDFQFHVVNEGAWLVPLKDVFFSLNPSTVTYKAGCPNATYSPGAIRIDSLPPGSRACVRTHRGGYAELRFNEQIAARQRTATVDFVYWAN
jgi:hypothetical protein